ncbi:hypothetical protein QUB60_29150 [Microcoleus sp. A2-C5]|uniref:2OG-Fe(II)-dependent halogenase WelO5 family protein n=1 Tax=unclassified Microcoleus TaxID=2642155 RepID=UPI002FD57678
MSDTLSPTPSIQLQGIVHPDSYFQIVERNEIDWQLWIDVLQGKVAGAMFRGALKQEFRQQICHNFWHNPSLQQKSDGSLSLDYHYSAMLGPNIGMTVREPLEVYFDQVEKTSKDVQALFANTGDFFRFLLGGIKKHLSNQGLHLRLAEYNGRKAAEYKMRSWGNITEGFALVPHEDNRLLISPHIKDFEVAQLVKGRAVIGVICLENSAGGGDLHYWNISPNDQTREVLRFQYDGVGYTPESLADFDEIVLPIRSGDIYLFDSTKVHAVGPLPKEGGQRSTISWFMGFLDSTTAIYWA